MKFTAGALAVVVGTVPVAYGFVAPSSNFNGVAVTQGKKAFGVASTGCRAGCKCPICYHGAFCLCSSCSTSLSLTSSDIDGHASDCSCAGCAGMVHPRNCNCSTCMGSNHSATCQCGSCRTHGASCTCADCS